MLLARPLRPHGSGTTQANPAPEAIEALEHCPSQHLRTVSLDGTGSGATAPTEPRRLLLQFGRIASFKHQHYDQTHDRSGAYIRCSESERHRFLMDAATERYDGHAVDCNLDTAFDHDSIRWYRAVYEARPGNRSYAALADLDFLSELGLLVEHVGGRLPTKAAILLFGANPTAHQLLRRSIVDCQRYRLPSEEAETSERWIDRLPLEVNLIRAWRSLIEDWYPKVAERPFQLDPASMQSDDMPPGYRAFRESTVNLLIHQDYADHTRKAVIRHYPDQTVF